MALWKFINFTATLNYVKSILTDLGIAKTAIMTILKALIFHFWGNSHFQMSKMFKNSKFRAAKMAKMPVLEAKIDFTQDLRGSKILKFPHSEHPISLPRSVQTK